MPDYTIPEKTKLDFTILNYNRLYITTLCYIII